MQPQETNTSEPAPEESSTNSTGQANFDFMLKDQPAQQRPSPGGKFSGLNRPAKLLIGAVVGLVVAIVAAIIFSGGGSSNSQQLLDLMAQDQEIIRVSQSQQQNLQDSTTKGLSATTVAALSSQKTQLGSALSKSGVKYSPKELGVKQNSATDAQLQAAAQNNNLDQAYIAYLKGALSTYLKSLNDAYLTSKTRTLQTVITQSSDSVKTLLDSPQFK